MIPPILRNCTFFMKTTQYANQQLKAPSILFFAIVCKVLTEKILTR